MSRSFPKQDPQRRSTTLARRDRLAAAAERRTAQRTQAVSR